MEKLRETPTRPTPPAPPGALLTTAGADVARVAADATARAAAVPLAPAFVTVTVKTTGDQVTRIAATPDTTVGEVMTQACRDLGVLDAGRYVLVARGEVIADPTRTLRDVVGEDLDTDLTTRLVRKPEAGAACPS